jgi:hypothetical protein
MKNIIYKGEGLENMIQRMPPWALDNFAEEQLEKLTVHWEYQPLTIQSVEEEGVLAGYTLNDIWTSP